MPIYEYQCVDCSAVLEVFQPRVDGGPRRCGFRCALTRGQQDELRGMGELKRMVSTIGGNIRGITRRDKPTMDEAVKAGFRFYENKGGGVLSKVAGEQGPETIKVKKET